jgi:Protein of unknown function (DUF2442)
MIKIESLKASPDWKVFYTLSNGEERSSDLKNFLQFDVFRELSEPKEFMKIHNGGYFVEWDAGCDLSLDTLNKNSILIRDKQIAA